jgi:hypothetical protein
MRLFNLRKLALLVAPLSLAACSTSHEFRVASVGDTEASETSAGVDPIPPAAPGGPGVLVPPGVPGGAGNPGSFPAGSPPTVPPPLIVASGNVLLGSAGRLAVPGGGLSGAAGVVNGTVSAVLLTTSQTVVQLADGPSLLVDGVGAALGEAVSIDVAKGQVVGGAQSLVGQTVPGVSNVTAVAGNALGASPPGSSAGGTSGRITAAAKTLPGNVATVLTPKVGVTSVVQPVVSPLSQLPVGR